MQTVWLDSDQSIFDRWSTQPCVKYFKETQNMNKKNKLGCLNSVMLIVYTQRMKSDYAVVYVK